MSKKKKKVRILWDRVFIAFVMLVLLLWIIATIFGKIFNSSPKPVTESSSYVEIEDSSKTSAENTINANFDFLDIDSEELHTGELILINNSVPFVIGEPADVESVMENKNNNYSVKDNTVSLKPEVITALNQMTDDFYSVKNINDIMVQSGFRSKDYQQKLYDDDLAKNDAAVSTLVAMPGHSEHHSGLAVDLAIYKNKVTKEFDGTGEYAWINENCYNYGLIQRYKEDKSSITGIDDEAWHFRYVGQPHAFLMNQKNLCFEEYIGYLKQFDFVKNPLQVTALDDAKYEIYFVKAEGLTTKVPVPKDKEYSMSGNNVDGFIVTVKI